MSTLDRMLFLACPLRFILAWGWAVREHFPLYPGNHGFVDLLSSWVWSLADTGNEPFLRKITHNEVRGTQPFTHPCLQAFSLISLGRSGANKVRMPHNSNNTTCAT